MVIRIDRILGVGLLGAALLAVAPARGEEREPGVWWEHTVQMEMKGMGMGMPPTTTKTCVPKSGAKEPPAADEHCRNYDVKVVGSRMTWKTECTAPEAMTGDGDMTWKQDSVAGVMNMHSAHGDMTMKMSGKKLGGDCDAGAMKKQVAAIRKQADDIQAQANQNMAEMCAKSAEEMQLRVFVPPLSMCKDPAQAAKACERLGTRAGYLAYVKAKAGDPELPRSAQTLCKKDPEEIRARLCGEATQEASGAAPRKPTLTFLARSCPDEARAYAVKACAGRSYSGDEGMDDPLREICVQYAKDELAKGGAKAAEPAEEPRKKPKDQAVDSAKKALKGLFGK